MFRGFVKCDLNLERIKNFIGDVSVVLTEILHRKDCQVDDVKLLLQQGAHVNCRDKFGYTPLMIALRFPYDEAVVRELLEGGADVNMVDMRHGETALLSYIKGGPDCSIGIVKLLVNYKANVNYMSSSGDSLLAIALNQPRDEAIIRVLLEGGADVHTRNSLGETPLCVAFRYYSNDIVKLLLEAGYPPTACKFHSSALQCATDFPHSRLRKDVLNLLLEANANVNSVDRLGRSVLCFALQHGAKAHDIQLLLGAGASLNHCTQHSSSLICAVKCHPNTPLRKDLIQLLLDNGACVDNEGLKVLSEVLALCAYETGAIQLLLNIPGMDGYVAKNEFILHFAVRNPYCRLDAIELLVMREAQVHSINPNGDTPLHCASGNVSCDPSVIRLLLKSGSSVNAKNKSGKTPLMLAVEQCCRTNILKELLLAGALIGKEKYGHESRHKCKFLEMMAHEFEFCRNSEMLSGYKMLIKFYLLQNPEFDIANFQRDLTGKYLFVDKLTVFLKECLSELRKMDSLLVGNGRTFRMFVSRGSLSVEEDYDLDRILSYMTKNAFNVFFDIINSRIDRSVMEAKVEILQVYTNKIPFVERINLNSDIVRNIAKYLPDDDLFKFIVVFYKPVNLNDSCEAKDDSLLRKRNSDLSTLNE